MGRFVIAIGAVLWVLARLMPSEDLACSLIPFPDVRQENTTYFLGLGLPDTVLATPGNVEFSHGPGHWGRALAAHRFYGQRIQVQRHGGHRSKALDSVFKSSGATEVILIPWDYDASCAPVPWVRSARWAPVDTLGFFRSTMRTEDHWIAGQPTLDVFAADLQPYPYGVYYRRGYRGTDALRDPGALSVEEFFELYAALPTWCDWNQKPDSALMALRQLEADRPDLVSRYPATRIWDFLQYQIGQVSAGPRDVSDYCGP